MNFRSRIRETYVRFCESKENRKLLLFSSYSIFEKEKTMVIDFQKRYGLIVDGIIGPQTRGKATEVKSVIDYILNGNIVIEIDKMKLGTAC